MLTTIKGSDGIEYHAQEMLLDDGHRHISPITDEYGRFIPADICICAAHNSFECACGAWDRSPYQEDFEEWYDQD